MRTGYRSVLACTPQLEGLAEQAGQAGAMSHLDTVLRAPYAESRLAAPVFRTGSLRERLARVSKQPVLLTSGPKSRLRAAALLFEYRLYGLATTIFVPSGEDGWRTLIAQDTMRLGVAAEAAGHLLRRRASIVLVSFSQAGPLIGLEAAVDEVAAPPSRIRLVASRVREVRRVMPLLDTFDETLATLGAHTRRNLRAARRRLAADPLAVTYHSKADLNLEQYLALNRLSRYPVEDWVARWRFDAVQSSPDGFLSGLRTAAGDWISVVGGRRHRDGLYIDWQLNRDDLHALSLGTAIRAWLLEEEVGRGTRSIRFEGGTPHSMQSGFAPEYTYDLLFTRRALPPGFLNVVQRSLPKGGQLGDFLSAPETTRHPQAERPTA